MSGTIFHNQPSISPLRWRKGDKILPAVVYALEMMPPRACTWELGLGWPKGLGGRLLPLELSSSFVPTIHGGMTQSFGDASTNGLEWSRRGRDGDVQDRSTTLFSHRHHKPSGRRTELAARSSFPIEPWLRSLKHDALCILHVAFCVLHLAEYCIATDSLLH